MTDARNLLRIVEKITEEIGAVTRDDLGHLGGDARFQPPAPDRSQQIATGQRPTAKRTALYWWGYWW